MAPKREKLTIYEDMPPKTDSGLLPSLCLVAEAQELPPSIGCQKPRAEVPQQPKLASSSTAATRLHQKGLGQLAVAVLVNKSRLFS